MGLILTGVPRLPCIALIEVLGIPQEMLRDMQDADVLAVNDRVAARAVSGLRIPHPDTGWLCGISSL